MFLFNAKVAIETLMIQRDPIVNKVVYQNLECFAIYLYIFKRL